MSSESAHSPEMIAAVKEEKNRPQRVRGSCQVHPKSKRAVHSICLQPQPTR